MAAVQDRLEAAEGKALAVEGRDRVVEGKAQAVESIHMAVEDTLVARSLGGNKAEGDRQQAQAGWPPDS